MASKKLKTKVIDIEIAHSGFDLFRRFGERFFGKTGEKGFDEISAVRSLLNNEKARILHVIKNQKPISVYSLARILGRDFQSVRKDIGLLEKLGFVYLEKQKGKRKSLKPVLNFDKFRINISF